MPICPFIGLSVYWRRPVPICPFIGLSVYRRRPEKTGRATTLHLWNEATTRRVLPAHQLSGFCVGLREAKRAINRKKCKVCWVPLGRNSWDFDDQPHSYIFGNLGNELRHRFFNHPPSRIDNRLKCCEFTRPLKLKPTEAWTSLIIMNQ